MGGGREKLKRMYLSSCYPAENCASTGVPPTLSALDNLCPFQRVVKL